MFEKAIINKGFGKVIGNNAAINPGEVDIVKVVFNYLKDIKVLTTEQCDSLCNFKFDLASNLKPVLTIDEATGEVKMVFGDGSIQTSASLSINLSENIKTDSDITIKDLDPYAISPMVFPAGTSLKVILDYLAALTQVNQLKEQQDDIKAIEGESVVSSTKIRLPDTEVKVYRNGQLIEKSFYIISDTASGFDVKFTIPFGTPAGSQYDETVQLVYFAQ